MRIRTLDPFQMNDWEITTTLKAVATLQFAVWILVALDAVRLPLPILQGLLVLVYLLFVPGVLILRSLRLHHLGDAPTLLYSVGLSVAAIMFTGLFMNAVYPLVGIERPFSPLPVVITMSTVTFCLAAVSYWRDRTFAAPRDIDLRAVITSPAPLLCLLPFMSVFATYALNVYHTNVILLLDIVIIGAVGLWAGGAAPFPKRWRALAIFTVALALLYHGSLITPYVWGWDIQKELYNANAVLSSGLWNQALPDPTNGVISVTLLAPLISVLSGISLTWVFKIVYPLMFALVPLGLFVAFRVQTNDKIAFLGAFFVASLFTFYGEMPALARQEIAELFFVLLLVLTVSTARSATRKLTVPLLYAVFAVSLVVSHYALAIIFLAYVVIAWLLLFLVDNPALRRLGPSARGVLVDRPRSPRRMLTPFLILPLAVFTGVWYLSAGSAALAAISKVLNSWALTTLTPQTVVGAIAIGGIVYGGALTVVYLIARRGQREDDATPRLRALTPLIFLAALAGFLGGHYGVSLSDLLPPGMLLPLHALGLVLYLLSVLMIVVGFVALALGYSRRRFNFEYVALALAGFIVLAIATVIPQLAFSLNTTRLFHVSMLLLAPFCVTGALFIAQPLALRINGRRGTAGQSLAQKLVAVFFVALFLFSTGFVYEVTQQGSTAFILNSAVDAPRFNDREVAAAQWMSLVRGSVAGKYLLPVYADAHRRALFDSIDLSHPATALPTPLNKTPSYAYVYLGTYNLKTASVAQMSATTLLGGTGIQYLALDNTTTAQHKIFDDGGAAIYL
ncbi:MAG: DUF2206 domain-containing protein [Halobacteriota archaeon]